MKMQDWDIKFLSERYGRLDKLGVKLVPLFCNLERNNVYKGRDWTGLRIAVVYSMPVTNLGSGYAVADEDTEETAMVVGEVLGQRGLKVEFVKLDAGNIGDLEGVTADVVFNLCEWTGRDLPLSNQVMEIMEKKRMVYTGSRDLGDKWEMKKRLVEAGVRTPGWQIVETRDEKIDIRDLDFPVIVKPVAEHCSIGLSQKSVVNDERSLREQVNKMIEEFKQPVLVEEFVNGYEYQATVLARDGQVRVLPPAEISYKKDRGDWPLLSFATRWDESLPDRDDPSEDIYVPVMKEDLWRQMEEECRKAFVGCNLSGYGRADMREKDGKIYMLEMNSNPGLEDHYSYGMALSGWTQGMTFSDLCFFIVTAALEKFGVY